MMVGAALEVIAGAVNRDLIRNLGRMNGWPEEEVPVVKPEALQHRDVVEVSTVIRDLSFAGAPMTRNDPAYGEIMDLLGLTRPPEETIL
jgi:hypothetical protein